MEPLYQIFRTVAKWSEDIPPGDDPPTGRWGEGLPPGRRWNSAHCMDRMYRENTTLEQAEIDAGEWWWEYQKTLLEKYGDLNRSEPQINTHFVRWATWCSGWFSHWTFDIGLSDAEVLDSFSRHVNQIELENYRNYRERGSGLMGAEDRWRWTARAGGTSLIGFGESSGEPPCRCEHCKEQGVVRIDH